MIDIEDRRALDSVARHLSDFALMNAEELKQHTELAAKVVDDVPGDIVECGVLNGGTAAALAVGLPNRTLWLYDSFEGFPDPSTRDPQDAWLDVGIERFNGQEAHVHRALDIAHVSPDHREIKRGWFVDTFKELGPEQIAILHIDCDWYDSTLLTLQRFYQHVSPGGLVIMDDWAWWEGSRLAFYDWIRETRECPLLWSFGRCQAYWIKGEERRRV